MTAFFPPAPSAPTFKEAMGFSEAAASPRKRTRKWSDDIDPATIPDAVILSERARRNSAKRATRSGGRNGGRPKGSKNKATGDPSPKPQFVSNVPLNSVDWSEGAQRKMKFRKKPVVIEAVAWYGKYTDGAEWPDWFRNAVDDGTIVLNEDRTLTIKTLEGDHIGIITDKIIKGVKGELYPCKQDIFDATYDQVLSPENSGAPAQNTQATDGLSPKHPAAS